jgi:hypothetical protein
MKYKNLPIKNVIENILGAKSKWIYIDKRKYGYRMKLVYSIGFSPVDKDSIEKLSTLSHALGASMSTTYAIGIGYFIMVCIKFDCLPSKISIV